ncbi:MAG TPA: MmgE/PrpD family protein [Solirubrobacteraceae bacterium]|jgi:2-methylcitrate dehydratase PrpD|nr:MmgE/PrpD family protein [Solirubrobacteraceae bacterium]
MSDRPPEITAHIASLVAEGDLGDDGPELRALARRALVDTVASTIAARNEPGVHALLRATARDAGEGVSTILTTGGRTSEAHAALVNGMASHALDYDDVVDALYGHPSAAMFPSLLAVAEQEAASGRMLLDAYVIGFQVICAVAAGLPIRKHYSRGWHSTATVGVLGATAALCRLLALPQTQVRRALGMAASMASGSRQNFGTMTKPLHPGLAGRSAITAARLAQEGFTADESQLEAPLGYFAMFGVDSDLAAVDAALDVRPWALRREGLNVKKYPCCYNTHRTADATLTLAPVVREAGEQVEAVRLAMEPGGFDPLIHHRPTTGLEGKFSAEYVVAAGLLDGHVGLDTFTDEAVARPEAQDLLRKVEVAEHATPPFGPPEWVHAYVTLEVDVGGHTLRERVDIPRGDARAPLSDEEVDAKLRDCVAFSGSGWDADALLAELHGLEALERFGGFAAITAGAVTGVLR